MKKPVFFGIVFLLSCNIFGQIVTELGPVTQSVLWMQVTNAAATASSIAEQVSNSIQQLQQLNRMVTTQAKALKKLGSGDWQSFIEFTYLQSQATAQQRQTLANVKDNLQKLKVEEDKLQDFAAMDEGLAYFSGFFNRTGNLLVAADNLQKNIEISAKIMDGLSAQKDTDSLITQLQIQNQELGLLRGIVADFANLTYTAQVNAEVEKSIAEAAEQKRADNVEKYLTTKRSASDYIGDGAEQQRNKEIREAQIF